MRKLKKGSIWLMIEIFFSITLLTMFFIYLISTIYSLKLNKIDDTRIIYENSINNLYVLENLGILNKLVDNFELSILKKYIEAMYPFTNKKIFIYDNAFVLFFVLDNFPDLNQERYVKFHYRLPDNVNNKTIVVKDFLLNSLPTKVSFNYYFANFLYFVSSLSHYNCTYVKIVPQNLPYDLDNIKKIRVFIDNFEIKNFSWTIEEGSIKLRINEKIETGSNTGKRLYIYVTNKDDEVGKEKSNYVDVSNCLSLTMSSQAELEFKKGNIATIEFNYKPKTLPDAGKFFFYLNFIANNDQEKFYIDNDVDNTLPYQINDSLVSIRKDLPIEYGVTKDKLIKWKVEKTFIVPYYYKDIYHELHFVIYRE